MNGVEILLIIITNIILSWIITEFIALPLLLYMTCGCKSGPIDFLIKYNDHRYKEYKKRKLYE
jgi:hypothetical protein